MLRALVDFALKNRWLVLGGVVVLTAWGVVSFRNLPIEAYPDVANNYVQIITQWPGRSAEEIERQVTVPVEIQMAGIPHLTHLRSTTLAGLSSLMLMCWSGSAWSACLPIWCRRWAPTGAPSARSTGTRWRAAIPLTT
jgi:cobalt-zinc-cadmium resistance protein CzcA